MRPGLEDARDPPVGPAALHDLLVPGVVGHVPDAVGDHQREVGGERRSGAAHVAGAAATGGAPSRRAGSPRSRGARRDAPTRVPGTARARGTRRRDVEADALRRSRAARGSPSTTATAIRSRSPRGSPQPADPGAQASARATIATPRAGTTLIHFASRSAFVDDARDDDHGAESERQERRASPAGSVRRRARGRRSPSARSGSSGRRARGSGRLRSPLRLTW